MGDSSRGRDKETRHTLISVAGKLRGLDPNLICLPKGHILYILSRRTLLAAHLKSGREPRIDDKVMSSLVCNQTSELKGKDDRLFKCKDS